MFAETVRADFPILATRMNGKPLIYFDNGATTQKPRAVLDAIIHYYQCDNANVHRGLYELSQRATDCYENARAKIALFLGGVNTRECIFTRGTTEGINLVASCWGRANLKPGDEVLLTGLEHHSNIVPWQFACQATGAVLKAVHSDQEGRLDLQRFSEAIGPRTRLVALQIASNALGVIHDVRSIVDLAHAVGARVLLDGAQAVAHAKTNLPDLDCDFFVFSGHKLYGPTGIGVLWGRHELLAQMPPFMGGGDMIEQVTFDQTTFAGLPSRFEAGTPHIAGAVGLAAAIDYLNVIGFEAIEHQEQSLLEYATKALKMIPGLHIFGDVRPKTAILSFALQSPKVADIDVATALGLEGIAIRTGHHCCMPLMHDLGVSSTCRASLAFYNTHLEIDRLRDVLMQLVESRLSSDPAGIGNEEGKTHPTVEPSIANIAFGLAAGDSPTAVAQELVEEFLTFDDQHSKTQLLLEFGQELPAAIDSLKQLTTTVPGCMSEVYLIGRALQNEPDRIEFAGDSNAQIVRGLIAVLQKLFSGQKATAVLAFDLENFFRTIGLDQFITSQRRSGLAGMVSRIRGLAESIAHE